jgi:hypothetical protein
MHLGDAELGAALDAAGGGATGTAARAHAAACDPCADALRAARTMDQQVGEILALLDHPTPTADRHRPALVVERGGRVRSRSETIKSSARRGAAILVVGAAVAAAAVPHSPVRQFLSRIVASPVHHALPTPVPNTPAAPAALPSVAPRGVAITSSDHIDLVFQNPQVSGELRIHPTLGTHVSVTASADGPTYTVGSATIVVDTHDVPGVAYDIDLPPAARVRSVTIRVGDRTVFSRRGTAVQTVGAVQGDGSYLVKLGTRD